jgi:hypothetical protein
MINIYNGEISIPEYNTVLRKEMTEIELQNTKFYKILKDIRKFENGYSWFDFNSFQFKNWKILLQICFKNSLLNTIELTTIEDNDSKTWNEWSEKEQINIYKRNSQFLKEILLKKGNESKDKRLIEYDFEWGSVYSTFDKKSASCNIGVKYNLT